MKFARLSVTVLALIVLSGSRQVSPRFSSDVPLEVKARVRSDLAVLDSMRGCKTVPLLQKFLISNKFDGSVLSDFFDSIVSQIDFDSAETRGLAYSNQPGGITLTPAYTKEPSQALRVSVLLHEAYHAAYDRSHVMCPLDRDVNVSVPNCDIAPDKSFGLQEAFLETLHQYCMNCPPEMKQDAGFQAIMISNRIINQEELFRELGPASDSCGT